MWSSLTVVDTCCFLPPQHPSIFIGNRTLIFIWAMLLPTFYNLVEQSIKVTAYSQLLIPKPQLMNMTQLDQCYFTL